MTILETKELKKYYDSGEYITKALDGVSLEIEEGEFVAIVGASGSGNSTLLNMIGGLDIPTSGSVLVKGKKIGQLNEEELTVFRRRNIGFVFQNYNLIPTLNVYENIVLPVELDGNDIDKDFLNKIVTILGIDKKLENLPGNLSGGQQQRVCIARVLAVKPEVILLDEPTSALDPVSSGKIESMLLELKNDYTMIMVTHNMQQASRISDKTAFFLSGDLIEYDKTKNIFLNPKKQQTEDYITGKFG